MTPPVINKELHPRKQVVYKFVLLCILLVSYFAYLSFKYDVRTGGVAAALTWSFFVLCTPIADAGFLLDFPLRLIFGIRMLFSEIAAWTLAIAVNIVTLSLLCGVLRDNDADDAPAYDSYHALSILGCDSNIRDRYFSFDSFCR